MPPPRPPRCERSRIRTLPTVTYEPPRPHATDDRPSPPRRDRPRSPSSHERPAPPAAPVTPRPFEIRTAASAQHVGLLTLFGALDAAGARQLLTATRTLLPTSHILILDLSGLTDCDLAGIHSVIEVDALARTTSTLLVIRPARGHVHRTFVDTGAAARLRIAGRGAPGTRERR